ncbi:MAG: CTP synthase [Acidobacteria bacterium]|nr:CTP synthase [Acidobacteriota bacterium]
MEYPKFIFVTGGVLSSLGKGIAAASIGALLKACGYTVSIAKLDPYLNVDPGTMSPFQHGEVFVTDDGAETDLDLGHYERFTGARLTKDHNLTAGKIYLQVIRKERRGDYLGKTVQVIPQVTDEIKQGILKLSRNSQVTIVEIGGTVGDIESLPFLESIRQMRNELGEKRTVFTHLTLVPFVRTSGELKTKPTQHSVKELREIGIQPDLILCRCEQDLPEDIKAKISLFCNVRTADVISAVDVKNIYEVPLKYRDQGLVERLIQRLDLPAPAVDLSRWEGLIRRMEARAETVTVAMVGKYTHLIDSYKSLYEAMVHGGIANDVRVDMKWIDSEEITRDNAAETLAGCHAVLVPGGFGTRGIDGKIDAIRYARERKVPFFGICLGMQCAVIEYARNVCGLPEASSTEFDPGTPVKIFYKLRELLGVEEMGGNMRLGAYACRLREGTLASRVYGAAEVGERHRHRYEFNRAYQETLEQNGMVVSGISPDEKFVEIVEIPAHPWFFGCQFHPEFKSLPLEPHPVFVDFIRAALLNKRGNLGV